MTDQSEARLLNDMPQRMHPKFFKRLLESLARLLAPLL
jgi:hypothetical protein